MWTSRSCTTCTTAAYRCERSAARALGVSRSAPRGHVGSRQVVRCRAGLPEDAADPAHLIAPLGGVEPHVRVLGEPGDAERVHVHAVATGADRRAEELGAD